MEDFCGDKFWDEDVVWAENDPDFTLCFQHIALVWIPCILLYLSAMYEILKIKWSKYRDIPMNILYIAKNLVVGMLAILAVIEFAYALYLKDNADVFDVFWVTPIFKFVSFVLILVLMHFHRKNGMCSPGITFNFWAILMFCAIFQYRTEITRFRRRDDNIGDADEITWEDFSFVSYMLYFPLVCVALILNCFAEPPPQISLYKQVASNKNPSPELTASYLRKLTFQYFDPVAWHGFRRPMEVEDIHDANPEDTSAELIPPFDKYWYESVDKGRILEAKLNKTDKIDTSPNKRTNGSVLPAMTYAFGGPFWFAGILKLALDLLQFTSPYIMRSLMSNIAIPDSPEWKAWIYSLALFVVAILTAILNGQYFYKTFIVGFRIRTALISGIYRKAIRISSSAKKDTTVGEIVNLMAVDAQRFFELTSYLHILWSGPVTIALCIYLLWDILGASVLVGLGVMLLMIPLSGFIALQLKTLQIDQMVIKDDRVKKMNEILSGIKVLKLYAWEPSFEDNVLQVRNEEMRILRKTAVYSAGTYFVWTMAPFLVQLFSFMTYVLVDDENVLDPETAFVSLALFNILRFPLTMFPMMITFAMQAWVSIKRIDKFMNSEEIDPTNVSHNKSPEALSISNGTFSWGDEVMTLKNINMKVMKNGLSAVVGMVGSGKSSLISALLGEMEKKNGAVNTDGTLAYVPQQAWIQNCTLRDNITFGKKFDPKLYDRVLFDCALKSDIAMLPGGDQTEIGEKGINLSGGQKQRVALARAVYNDAEVYLLDDPLSAVDSHVGKHIFDHVIGPNGCLAGKTRLLVTHGVSYLPFVDEIFVMNHGEITESGSYKQLLEQKGAFADFLVVHMNELDEDDEELEKLQETLKAEEPALLSRAMSVRSSNSSKGGSVRKRRVRRESSTKSGGSKNEPIPDAANISKQATLIEKEEAATGAVGFAVYWQYFKSIGIWTGSWALFFNAANQGLSVYASIWLTDWSEDPEASTDNSVRDKYLGVYGALGGGQAITLFIGSILMGFGCLYAARDSHDKLLKHSLRLPMSFFDTTPLGRVMNRFSKDMDVVDNILPMSIRAWLMMTLSVVGIIVAISRSTPIFLSVVAPLLLVYYFIQVFYVATSRQLKRLESITRSPIYSHFSESITGQSTINAYGQGDRFITESENRVDFNQLCSYPSIVANRWLSVRLETIGAFVVFFAAVFAVLAKDSISAASVGLSISYALQVSQTLSFLVRMTAEVETNIVAIERLDEYSVLPTEADWKKGEIPPAWPQEGKVIFQDFQLRYRDGLDLVLKGISLSVSGGEKIGIVGRTGAGKSSLTLALFRIIEAAGGKIVIDGIDISTMGLHQLRGRLTIIPQDPVLFSGSLRMNIDPFNAYTDDDIWRVLEHSHLKSFVKGLPTGLEHEISEGGENLSVGQRQLVCLGRALLRKTKVLILDEATAAVDLDTDDLIQKTIRTEFKECTILTIAHRLNTILDSDRVIVLDKGYIVEFDSPDNLLANTNSIFHSMAKDAGLVNAGNNATETEEGTRM